MFKQLPGFLLHWQFIHSLPSPSMAIQQVKYFLGSVQKGTFSGNSLCLVLYFLCSSYSQKLLCFEIACIDLFWKLALEPLHIKFFSVQTIVHRIKPGCEFRCLHLRWSINVEDKYDSPILGSRYGLKKLLIYRVTSLWEPEQKCQFKVATLLLNLLF